MFTQHVSDIFQKQGSKRSSKRYSEQAEEAECQPSGFVFRQFEFAADDKENVNENALRDSPKFAAQHQAPMPFVSRLKKPTVLKTPQIIMSSKLQAPKFSPPKMKPGSKKRKLH